MILKIVKIVRYFVQGRKIDVQKGMPSFASIPVTLRTLLKKNRGRVGSEPPPPQVARVKTLTNPKVILD